MWSSIGPSNIAPVSPSLTPTAHTSPHLNTHNTLFITPITKKIASVSRQIIRKNRLRGSRKIISLSRRVINQN